jgi:ribonucleoside-diphosphate reductase alpha chain
MIMAKSNYKGLEIDYSRDSLIDAYGHTRFKDSYMTSEETSPQERFANVSLEFGTDLAHSQRLYDYASRLWLSYSTPILSFGRSKKGMPISCFLNVITDTAEGLVDTLSETNWLSMMGGGVGTGFNMRSADDKSTGVMPHLKIYDASSLAYRQGKTRRGSYAAYLDISHPDLLMFLEMRKPTGDQNIRCQNLHHGINITDKFMQIIEKCMTDPDFDDSWELIDPHSKLVKEVVSAKELWQKIIELRMQTGEPYLHFIDTSNAALPKWLKDKGLRINNSNLCVSGDTLITISSQDFGIIDTEIKELENYLLKHNDLQVLSYNTETNQKEFKKIEAFAQTSPKSKVMKITDEKTGKFIKCTPDHKIFTKNRGYVMAKDLSENDELELE